MTERRTLDFRSFEELAREVRKLRDRGYEQAGNWTLAQNCDHLRLFITYSLDGFPFKLPFYIRLAGPFLKKRTLESRKLPTGVKVPPALMPKVAEDIARPENSSPDVEAANRLIEAIDRYTSYKGAPQPSPLFGKLDRESWDQLHLIHAAHHLSFLVPVQRETRLGRGKKKTAPGKTTPPPA